MYLSDNTKIGLRHIWKQFVIRWNDLHIFISKDILELFVCVCCVFVRDVLFDSLMLLAYQKAIKSERPSPFFCQELTTVTHCCLVLLMM